jgi:hypothetical protein
MSALPLIEAVRRAGGTIALQGDRLRLAAPEPLPQELLEEVRLHKADLIDQLRCAAPPLLREPPADPPRPGTASPTGTIATWVNGVARLRAIPPPPIYPQHAWQQLIIDAERFLDGWAQQAVALGWPIWELFGCHRGAPWGRIAGMGLILLLRGDEIAALTRSEAMIRTRTGARQIYRRRPRDPLCTGDRCLIWELDRGR